MRSSHMCEANAHKEEEEEGGLNASGSVTETTKAGRIDLRFLNIQPKQ